MMSTDIKVALLIHSGGSVLLIKEWSKKRSGYYWNIIKGSYGDHLGETILQCASREALEEAGVTVKITNFISCFVFNKENGLGIQYNFLGTPVSGKSFSIPNKKEQGKRDEDIQEIRWFTKNELSGLHTDEFISERTQDVISSWLKGKKYAIDIFKQFNGK